MSGLTKQDFDITFAAAFDLDAAQAMGFATMHPWHCWGDAFLHPLVFAEPGAGRDDGGGGGGPRGPLLSPGRPIASAAIRRTGPFVELDAEWLQGYPLPGERIDVFASTNLVDWVLLHTEDLPPGALPANAHTIVIDLRDHPG
ncbi:MAG: hypothetical protein FWG50_12800, partial [Kiritimatiellaeota bacterium]|nr:hypothetical protein [Kiritimatiellota bacterium]